jgi:hypothetical protein
MTRNIDQLTNVFTDSVTHIPEDVNPIGVAAGLAVAAVGIYGARKTFDNASEQFELQFNNPALLEKANEAVGGDDGKRNRLRPATAFAISAGALAMHFIGSPSSTESKTDDSAAVAAVVDVSYSMTRTQDMDGQSRLDAVLDALSSNDYSGKLSVITAAKTAKLAVPLSEKSDWESKLTTELLESVNSNGGDIAAGIQLAADTLPNKSGTVLVVSDGTIDQNVREISLLSDKLIDQGIDLQVVVPGTSEGTYTLSAGGSPVEVGVEPDVFKNEGVNVVSADSTEKLQSDISETVENATSTSRNQSWPGFLLLGGVAGLYGAARSVNTLIRRRA